MVKSKLKRYLNEKGVLDIVIFGSAVKGKALPRDIDVVVISEREFKIDIPGFHVNFLKPDDFFKNPPTLVNTLFREGYSLKNGKSFSEIYRFKSKVLFRYELKGLRASLKVKVVNVLRGKGVNEGLVLENGGEWLANQIFIVPIGNENLFEKFFLNFKIKFNKSYILMH